MKKFFNAIHKVARKCADKVQAALIYVYNFVFDLVRSIMPRLCDQRGDLATNTIGGIIIAVVIIGLLIIAINAFFPNFFTSMFQSMQQKLNANW